MGIDVAKDSNQLKKQSKKHIIIILFKIIQIQNLNNS